MRFFALVATTLSIAAHLVEAGPISRSLGIRQANADASVLPQNDPFYTPAAGYENAKPGDILKTRDVKVQSDQPLNVSSAKQLQYRTTHSDGSPTITITTVITPYNARSDGSMLIYEEHEDSANLKCAPSYKLQQPGNSSSELVYISFALDKGLTVNIPDYEGIESAFTDGQISARGSLDAIRAGLNALPTDKRKTAKAAITGHSGGALAAGWAVQEQPTYAPELEKVIVGSVLSGLPVDILDVVVQVQDSPFSSLSWLGIQGQANIDPSFDKFLKSHMDKEGLDNLAFAKENCLGQARNKLAFTNFFKHFPNKTQEQVIAEPAVQAVVKRNRLGAKVPKTPVYAYHAILDEIVVPANIDKWAKDMCDRGIPSLTLVKDALGEHVTSEKLGAASAFKWLLERLDGKPAKAGCRTELAASSLTDPIALLVFGPSILSNLKASNGLPLGPDN